jgi:dTDP-4-amino-4,6-dideoxygalactose transaminase
MEKIAFNKPYLTGKETHYIYDAVNAGKISGNGKYTKLCQDYLKERYSFGKCLLTTSCTDALEMAALLIDVKPGDEVIMPSYTFVSTANAFVLRGAKIIFADSRKDHPGIDEDSIEALITAKTKAIVPVHYAGVACDMDKIMALADKYELFVIEDAAQAIESFYTGKDGIKRALGSIGHLAAFSFHETKNIISGEGGMLAINDPQFMAKAEIIWEKGTNRSAFFRGEVDKYGWVAVGSSFLPSEIIAAFLWAQLENLDDIQTKRVQHWNKYQEGLKEWAMENDIRLPVIPDFATNNAHMFYLVCKDLEQRNELIEKLKSKGILAVFHYLSLHKSPFYIDKHDGRNLVNADRYTDCVVRLPFFYELEKDTINFIKNELYEAVKNI